MRGTASMTIVYVHPAEAQIEHAIEEYLRRRDPIVLADSEHAGASLVREEDGITEQEMS